MYIETLKEYGMEVVSGTRFAWSHKWQVVSVALALVVVVQGLDISYSIPEEVVEYQKEITEADIALQELDSYVNKLEGEIFARNESIYRDMARQEAIRQAGRELYTLSQVFVHVDYELMNEALEMGAVE